VVPGGVGYLALSGERHREVLGGVELLPVTSLREPSELLTQFVEPVRDDVPLFFVGVRCWRSRT
jgi:hypothetical protein